MPTAWGCGVVIAAWKGGSARLHAPEGSSWSRWVRTAQGRPASRRSMWPSRCWVGSFIVRAGGRECWLAAPQQWWWWWCVGWVSWDGGPPPRRVSARCHGRWHAWRAAARWVGCRLPLNVQRFPPFSSTECSVPDVVRPTAHPCYTCDSFFLYAFPPSSADGPAGVLDIFVTHTASQQSREHTYNLLFPHVSWGPGGRRVRRESMP
jgi:hypothetical protein